MTSDLPSSALGPLPHDWKVMSLGSVTERIGDSVDVAPDVLYREIGIRSHGKGVFHKEPVKGTALGAKRVFGVVPHCLVFNIVFAWEGAVAVTTDHENGMIASHRFPMFVPTKANLVDAEFLRRFFQTPLGIRLLGDASPGGAGRNRTLNQKFTAQIPVPVPPLPEQWKIATILSSVEAVIEITQAIIDQLHAVKRAVMADLLTRGVAGDRAFKRTKVGDLPEDWEVVRLGDVGRWLSGGTPSKQDSGLWTGSIPWVSPKDMKRPRISEAIDHVSEAALRHGTQLAPMGSVLMVVRGMILAHTFPVAVATAPVAFNQDIKALIPADTFDAEFVMYCLQHLGPEILKHADVANHGTKRLPSELLFDTYVPHPPVAEQRTIVEILRTFDSRHSAESAHLLQLRAARAALMSVFLTGEVRVKPDEDAA